MILSTHLFCLLNLSTTPQFCPPLLLSYTFDVLNLICQHNQPNTILYLLCAIYYTLYTMHYSLCTMHYALYTMHYLLCTALCIIYYALFTMHYILCIMHYTLYIFTMHYALFIHTYSNVFTILYVFICIYYFTWKSARNPVILVLTRSSRRVE